MSNLSAIERALKVAQERARARAQSKSGYAEGGEVEPGVFDQIGQSASNYMDAFNTALRMGLPMAVIERAMGRDVPEFQGQPGVAGTTVDMQPQQFGLGSEQIPVAMGGRDMVAVSEDDAGNLYNAAGEVIGNQRMLQERLDRQAQADLDAASWYERPVAKAFASMPEPMQNALSMPATLLAMPEIMVGAGKQKFDAAVPKPNREETYAEALARGAGRVGSVPSALIEGIEMTARDANAKLYDEYLGNRVLSDDERARAVFDIASLTPAATAATGAARAGSAGPRGWRAQAEARGMAPEEALAALTRSNEEARAALDAYISEQADGDTPAIGARPDPEALRAYYEDQARAGLISGYGYVTPQAAFREDIPFKSYRTTDLSGREGEGSALQVDPSEMGRVGRERAKSSFDLREGDVGAYDSDVPGVAALQGADKLAGPDGINLDYADILMNMQRPAKLFSGSDEASIPGVVVGAADGLPMDTASRQARAREMGFDPDGVWYHGTEHQFDAFAPNSHFGTVGQANMRADVWPLGDDGRVVPVVTRGNNYHRMKDTGDWDETDFKALADQGFDGVEYLNRYEGIPEETIRKYEEGGNWWENALHELSDEEFKAIAPEAQYSRIVFDPKNVRSVSAAFDPTRSDSANILAASPDEASIPGVVVAGAERPRAYPMAARDNWYGDANYETTGGQLTQMAPDDFLARSRPMEIDEVARENIDDLKRHILEGGELDPLALYKNGKEDGRHRAIAAKELGISEVPVLVWSNSDEAAIPGVAVSANPTVRAAQNRAANVPFEDKLAVQHNMRGKSFAHNERSYDGNIPVPSLAVSKAGQPLTNFGDISLFGDPSMAIPKGSNPVYPADAYTKRAPKIEMDVPNLADRDRIVEKLTGQKGKGYTLDLSDPYWDDNFRIGYLRSKGLTPPEGVRPDDWARNAIGYGERDAMEAFVNDFLDSNRGLIRERIYQGWNNSGERQIYKPHTLDNMVKASKGKAGSEDFDYGPNAWRAHTMRPFNSLAEIQENRGLINRVPKEEMDALRNDLAEKGFRLTEAMGYRDTYADMVKDGLRHPDPEVRNLAKELRDDLAKLPTEYFEAKPQRAVGINEFKLAAVPETMPDVARSLDKKGLDVRTYDRSRMGEFGEPLTEILRSRPDLLFSGKDEAAAPAVTAAADRMRRNQPFYGEDVGPAGRIADPAAEAQRLELRSGVAGAPSKEGFFNPATSALLQQGVAPKQTVAYYKKQMGARGGKLPPGMWDKAVEGLRSSDVIERDWLVQQIDDLTPQIDRRKFSEVEEDTIPSLPSNEAYGEPQYQGYATRGPFENYTETAVGYKSRNEMKPTRYSPEDQAKWGAMNAELNRLQKIEMDMRTDPARRNTKERGDVMVQINELDAARNELAVKYQDRTWDRAGVKPYDDSHFDHPNLEGWYRTQDAAKTRILEEVQPQRNEKIRELGAKPGPQVQAEAKMLYERALANRKFAMQAVDDFLVGLGAIDHNQRNNLVGMRARLAEIIGSGDASKPNVAQAIKLRDALAYEDNALSHAASQFQASTNGINPSPYSHSVNDATDILLKNAVRDAVVDDVDRLAWTPGEVQAERYNQITRDVTGLIYRPETKQLQAQINRGGMAGSKPIDIPAGKTIEDIVGPEIAARLMSAPDERGTRSVTFQSPITIGGEGMKGFYGSGPTGKDGILTNRIKSLNKTVTGREADVNPANIAIDRGRRDYQPREGTVDYPSIELTPEFKEKARKIGLSLYANDEKAGLLAAAVASSKIPKEIDAYGFYSPSLEAVKNIPQQKGTVSQFRSMILDKKYGGKPKELDAVGFDRAFPDPNAKVTRQQVEDFLRQNRVELETATYGNESLAEQVARVQRIADDPNSSYAAYARKALEEHASGDSRKLRDMDVGGSDLQAGRFERYSTPGGERYRETVKTLKGNSDQPFTHPHWPGVDNPVLHYRTKDFKSRPDANSKTRVLEEVQSDWGQRGREKGFGSADEAARLQVEYNNITQKRFALQDEVREILSKPQYDSEQGAIAALWDNLSRRSNIYGASDLAKSPHNLARFFRDAAPFMDEADAGLGARLAEELLDLSNQSMDISGKLAAARSGVPDGPYVGNTSDWVDRALKEALVEAARDPSITEFAWAPGDVQNKRYNLSQHVDEIVVRPMVEGFRTVEVDMPGRGKLRFTVNNDGILNGVPQHMEQARGQPLSSLIGDGLAQQAMEATRPISIRGENLDVGGQGQRKFYGIVGPDGTVVEPGIVGRRLLKLIEGMDPEAARIGVDQARNYPSIPMTDTLRQKILDEGFGLFANKDEAVLPGIVTSAAGEKAIKELTPRQLDDLGLYSHLGETLDTVEMKNATPLKWRSELKNRGVKDEELRWTGMDKWLASLPQNEKVPVDQLKAYFNENKVKLEKHKFDEDGYSDEDVRDRATSDIEPYNYTSGIDPDWLRQQEARYSIVPDPDNEGAFAIMDEDGEVIGGDYATEQHAQRELDDKVQQDAEDFGEWAVFGENDEVISSGYSSRDSAESAASDSAYNDAFENIASMTTEEIRKEHDMPAPEQSSTYLDDRVEGGDQYEEHIITVPQEVLKRGGVDKSGLDAHFRDDVDNVLGWNLTERYEDIPTGGKVRMIHENQSDWGQRGSDQGFSTASPEQVNAAQNAFGDAEQAWRNESAKFVEIPGGGGVARILTADHRDARNIGSKLTAKHDVANDIVRTKKEAERIENAGADDPYVRSRLSSLYTRVAQQEQYLSSLNAELANLSDRYRMLDLSEAGMQPDAPMVQDVRDWAEWKTTTDDLRLKKQEAQQKVEALMKGVAEGPFVTDPADWTRLTLKNALYEAARGGDRYLAWSDPDTLNERWSGHEAGMNEHYGKRIPNIVQKLAKEHDPDAKLTEVYPGAPFTPRGEYHESPHYRNTEPRLPDLPFAERDDHRIHRPFDNRYEKHQDLRVASARPVAEIVAVPEKFAPGDERLVYQLRNSSGKAIGTPFRSKEAAEAAMSEINRRLEAKGRKTKEEIEAMIADGDNDWKKFQAVEITDRMRDSIKKRGFRMFNQPREAFLAGIAPALSDREAKIERALKIAGAKKPKSKREIN